LYKNYIEITLKHQLRIGKSQNDYISRKYDFSGLIICWFWSL